MSAFDAIPSELRALDRWVVWRWGDVDPKTGKRKKPPYCPTDLSRHGSSTNEATWSTFDQALAVVEAGKADGIGFALGPPYVGIDLDEELPEADKGAIMGRLDSYSERSVSGTGYHVVIRANLNGSGRHPKGIGIFQVDRFFYFSGEHVRGTPTTIEERQAELELVRAHFLPVADPPAVRDKHVAQPVDLDNRELLERARNAENGAKFRRLYDDGDTSGYPSRSEADLALCNMLAFWTGRDSERIDRLFRESGLMREGWEQENYRKRTIKAAIATTKNAYEGPPEQVRPSGDAPGTHFGFAPGLT